MNIMAGVGVAVREFPLKTGFADYLLYADGKVNQDLGLTRRIKIALPLPPLSEQHAIVEEVERRVSLLNSLESELATSLRRATRLRQSILKRAFEGKLVPQDSSDEPASALLERIRTRRREATAGSRAAAQRRGREIAAKGGPRMLTDAERDFLRQDKVEVMRILRARRRAT